MAAAPSPAIDSLSSADERRKRLGQYFTGLATARLLAALARSHQAHTIIDPMVGSGDMLVGALAHGRPNLVGGFEIDPTAHEECLERLEAAGLPTDALVLGSAFAPLNLRKLPTRAWDLVITNPPYVRYQSSARATHGGLTIPSGADIRRDLRAAVDELDALDDEDKQLFGELVSGYSGLSDLAVPSWILCAGLVRVGGTLAMLVPTTWLSRDYAHPIRYLIDRWFDVRCVVEDGDASWFRDALVRTTLVVAERIARRPSAFHTRPGEGHLHLRLTATMRAGDSLVGGLFAGHDDPDLELARTLSAWSAHGSAPADHELHPRWVSADGERASLRQSAAGEMWLSAVGETHPPTSVSSSLAPHSALVSESGARSDQFLSLDDLGWRAGQGLRTGANRFFYLTVIEPEDGHERVISPDAAFAQEPFRIPSSAARPVLRRQAELPDGLVVRVEQLTSRVLVLDHWALPEDLAGLPPHPYQDMPEPLASFIRRAAKVDVGSDGRPRFIPQLTAVAPNARAFNPQSPQRPGRFWYQLPPLTDRHLPSLLLARVNNRHPRTCVNEARAAVIDANFSTLWPTATPLASPWALTAVLNSAWSVAEMELRGTVLGGGALKVEATQLRRLPIPRLSDRGWVDADALGRRLSQATTAREVDAVLDDIDHMILAALGAADPRRAALSVRALAADWLKRRTK